MDGFPDRIVVAESGPVPYRTAADVLGSELELPVAVHDTPQSDAINLGPVLFAERLPEGAAAIAQAPAHADWNLIHGSVDGSWLVSASTPLGSAHAALQLLDWLREGREFDRPFRELRTSQFRSMALEFDDWTGGFNRRADGFDIEVHARDIVRVGGTSLEVNMLADVVPAQVRERRVSGDMYQWWCAYSAALDMFVESTLNRGTYDHRLLERNLAKLKQYYITFGYPCCYLT